MPSAGPEGAWHVYSLLTFSLLTIYSTAVTSPAVCEKEEGRQGALTAS